MIIAYKRMDVGQNIWDEMCYYWECIENLGNKLGTAQIAFGHLMGT
jgi:hypothetical protein